jgi:hypothetical protein
MLQIDAAMSERASAASDATTTATNGRGVPREEDPGSESEAGVMREGEMK